jgi:curved DNA-binding protein CbpA
MYGSMSVHGSMSVQAPMLPHGSSNGSSKRGGIDNGQITHYKDDSPSWHQITKTPKQKALSYFASCLEVLNIQEEVALTEDTLKSAYKKAALRAHPDKGGSEEFFEAVTRAYAYLSEILKHINGNKNRNINNPGALSATRDQESEKWKYVDPVKLNPKNLDMNAFNKIFEQTHVPDPDTDGYGDWLKTGESGGGSDAPKFSGKFNRDVFNQMFENEAQKNNSKSGSLIVHPGEMALTLAPALGTDLISEKPSSFTAAPNSKFQFTDLRGAYTTENTISEKVSGVVVENRSYDQYKSNREKGPAPLTQTELHHIQEFEQRQKQVEQLRERKRAEMHVRNQQYFDNMQRLLIVDKS